MSQRASELRHRVTIQKYVQGGRDEDGYPIQGSWQLHKKLFAKVTHLSGDKLIAAQANQSKIVARIKLRYREDIENGMRVIHKGQTYAIDSPSLDDNGDSYTYVTFLLSTDVEKFPGG